MQSCLVVLLLLASRLVLTTGAGRCGGIAAPSVRSKTNKQTNFLAVVSIIDTSVIRSPGSNPHGDAPVLMLCTPCRGTVSRAAWQSGGTQACGGSTNKQHNTITAAGHSGGCCDDTSTIVGSSEAATGAPGTATFVATRSTTMATARAAATTTVAAVVAAT